MPFICEENAVQVGRPTQFNSITGAIAGRIGGKHPKLHLRKRPPKPESWEEQAKQTAINRQLRVIAEQIKNARVLLNSEDYRYCEHCQRAGVEPHHRAQLLRALSQLLEDERVLRQIAPPKPQAADRAAPKRAYAPGLPAEPAPASAAPQAVVVQSQNPATQQPDSAQTPTTPTQSIKV